VSVVRAVKSGNQMKQGRLSAAVGAHQTRDARIIQLEADIVDGRQTAEAFGQVIYFEHFCNMYS